MAEFLSATAVIGAFFFTTVKILLENERKFVLCGYLKFPLSIMSLKLWFLRCALHFLSRGERDELVQMEFFVMTSSTSFQGINKALVNVR